jgi:predicted AlkP superfamily phosphohydrolase/phosphomutase
MAYDFRDPRTGRKLIGEVVRREEVYSGPFVERAPDLILRPQDPSDIFFGLADFGHQHTVDTVYRYSGMHRDHGMLIMNGPGIRQGGAFQEPIIYDLAPTVLHAMGMPVPEDMDGHILEEALTDGYMERFPARTLTSSEPGTSADGVDYSKEGEKEIMERLQGLGYLG